MIKLRVGYFITGITTGLIILFTFLWTLPDGKMHIYVCNVGQGDGTYIRFPDGRDMVIDAGPDTSILQCLGKYMPFWDRYIDVLLLTHPQKDHMQGFLSIVDRYRVGQFLKSDVDNDTDGYARLQALLREHAVPIVTLITDDRIDLGRSSMRFYWPSAQQIAKGKSFRTIATSRSNVLGATSYHSPSEDINHFSLVFILSYGSFDMFFPGDADSNVEPSYTGQSLADESLEVLKVPHHGSRTGMTSQFLQWLRPKTSIISVGKNSYGHPSADALQSLASIGSHVYRTDTDGDIEIISDGKRYQIKTHTAK